MTSPWLLLEEALELSPEERLPALREVLEELQSSSNDDPSDICELRSVVLGEMAGLDDSYLEEARQAVDDAVSIGREGWPNYHLGASLVRSGEPEEALVQLGQIPDGFFESRDLAWRSLHVDELKAVVLLDLQQHRRAARLVDKVAAALASRGDEDDLAPPVDLVEALLRHARGPGGDAVRTMLAVLATSVDLETWIGPERASKVSDALESSTSSQ